MKILLFGATGQVGWELRRSLAVHGDVFAIDSRCKDFHGDFSEPEALAGTVRRIAPHVIVNAAAYTAVDRAEAEAARAAIINAHAPAVLAREARAIDTLLVHYSTDYIFDGSGSQPRAEGDPAAPLNVYGRSKLDGEIAVRASGCRHLILRTSWVHSARGSNFARTILDLAALRHELEVIDDQVGAPTGADLLADVTACALRRVIATPELGGTYHAVASGHTSWHAYARMVVDWARDHEMALQLAAGAIRPVPSSAFAAAAQRPLNSRLDTRKLRDAFGLRLPPWQAGVERMLGEIAG